MAKWGDLRLEVTPRMRELLSSVLSADDLPAQLQKDISTTGEAFVSVTCLRHLYNKASESTDGTVNFRRCFPGNAAVR